MPADQRPNILLFLTDDHAQWALPCYGETRLRTPHLDRLARNGVVFDNAFTPSPVCSPARACLLTGMMPTQHGVHDFLASAEAFNARPWLAGIDSLPEQMARAGYRTGLAGKWHLGNDATPQPGFSDWYALGSEYPRPHEGEHFIDTRNGRRRHSGWLTDTITDCAAEFLADAQADRPYFLTIGYYGTHSPFLGHPEDLVAPYRDTVASPEDDAPPEGYALKNLEAPDMETTPAAEALAQYFGAISHIDSGVGRLLRLAEQCEARTGRKTVIIYTSDHGLSLGRHGVWGKGNATRPANMLETSIRVPLIAAGSAVTGRGRVGGMVDHLDLYATLRALAGLDTPEADRVPRAEQPFTAALSGGEAPAKQIQFGEYGPLRMARSERYKLIMREDGPRELYDLREDPMETRSVAGQSETLEVEKWLGRMTMNYFESLAGPSDRRWRPCREPRFNFKESWR